MERVSAKMSLEGERSRGASRGLGRFVGILLVGSCGVLSVPSCGPFNLGFPGAMGGGPPLEAEGEGGATGGSKPSSGGSVGEGGGPGKAPPPCIAKGSCEDACGSFGCDCENSFECPLSKPYCDVALGSCVECLRGEDCEVRFGSLFPACSAGRCVQCQSDFDCSMGAVCRNGWCGSCDEDDDCADGFECVNRHCQPRY